MIMLITFYSELESQVTTKHNCMEGYPLTSEASRIAVWQVVLWLAQEKMRGEKDIVAQVLNGW